MKGLLVSFFYFHDIIEIELPIIGMSDNHSSMENIEVIDFLVFIINRQSESCFHQGLVLQQCFYSFCPPYKRESPGFPEQKKKDGISAVLNIFQNWSCPQARSYCPAWHYAFRPGFLNSHGTPTWHLPQPYRGAYFAFIFSTCLLHLMLFLPCFSEIAFAGQFLTQAPHLMQ